MAIREGHSPRIASIMQSRNYTDLIAWQKAMALAEVVYSTSSNMPGEERFGLTQQMRRAAVSIPSNIAEGEGRRTDGEFLNQLSVAHGSVRELETHVMLAQRLRLLTPRVADQLLSSAGEVGRLVTGLAKSIERRSGRRLPGQPRSVKQEVQS